MGNIPNQEWQYTMEKPKEQQEPYNSQWEILASSKMEKYYQGGANSTYSYKLIHAHSKLPTKKMGEWEKLFTNFPLTHNSVQ